MIKPPPGMRLPVIDNMCSTWDILRDFAPQGERQSLEKYEKPSFSDYAQERQRETGRAEEQKQEEAGEHEVDGFTPKLEEDNASRLANVVAEFSGCSFTTSNEDDSSSSSTGPRSTNISPNVRFRRIIANWKKGELLGRGSFGSVHEGISGTISNKLSTRDPQRGRKSIC